MRDQSRHYARILALGLASAAILLLGTTRLSAQVVHPNWTYTGNLNVSRQGHTATLLQNGKVLVAGGYDGSGAVMPHSGKKNAEISDIKKEKK